VCLPDPPESFDSFRGGLQAVDPADSASRIDSADVSPAVLLESFAETGPKGPSPDVIAAVVDMKRRNPRHRGAVDGVALCRMFNRASSGQPLPMYRSADHDPLYRFQQWQANLRILNIQEVKTVPHVPRCHAVVERLIGTVRRECLDRLLFWTAADLDRKLAEFQQYYNEHRTHAGRAGRPPSPILDTTGARARLRAYRWAVALSWPLSHAESWCPGRNSQLADETRRARRRGRPGAGRGRPAA